MPIPAPCVAFVCLLLSAAAVAGQDWPRFRGPNGAGIAAEQTLPAVWSPTQNLRWAVDLPGPGASSPIVVGDRVMLTYWSGYAVDADEPGEQENLQRHLRCLDRRTGKVLWDHGVAARLPEDRYGGMFAQHGYASHTPVSDGEMVFAFFGKSGVLACDLEGKEAWRADVGDGLDGRGWGSASSPIVYRDLLIVPAFVESRRLIAFDKASGRIVWEQEADGFASCWTTPVIATSKQGRDELVVAVPFELWAFDPATGKLLWYCETTQDNSAKASAVTEGDMVYVLEGRQGGAVAVRTGGEGDVSQTHVAWRSRRSCQIGTPLVHDGKVYWLGNGVAMCLDAHSGQEVYVERLHKPAAVPEVVQEDRAPTAPESPVAASQQAPREGRFGYRRRGFSGFGSADYSSPLAGDGKLFLVTRRGTTYVVKLGEQFEQVAVNSLDARPREEFAATPAISGGALFIRSSQRLFCIAQDP